MANRYLRSTDGSDGDGGTTWALAKATLSGVAAIDTAGDFIYVSQVHAENTATAQTWGLAGSLSSFTRLICGNDGAEPPTAVATTASITNTATGNAITLTGNAYIYGLKFTWNAVFVMGGGSADELQTYDTCQFILAGGGSSCNINDQASSARKTARFINCQFKFDAIGEFIAVTSAWHIRGGSVQAGTTTPTVGLFRIGQTGRGAFLLIEDFDWSNCSSSLVLIDMTNSVAPANVILRNCKMPSGWSTSTLLSAAVSAPAFRVELWNCDNGSTNYRVHIDAYAGKIDEDIANFRSGGYSDGTTPLSWKMVGTASAAFPNVALTSPEFSAWNETTGSAVTATVEVLTDNVTLTDAQCWLEVHYPGTSGQSIYTTITDSVATILTTAANQTTSSATWTTTAGTPVKQKLEVTFTPQAKGPIYAKVHFSRNATVYVDPALTIA